MLALDSTIGCIEVSESEVVELFRAAPVTRSASPNAPPETVEAYVCAVKKKASVKVYLSFVINDRNIYVYAVPGKGATEAEYPKQMEEALEYARAMGFSPQAVDLSYSPAMREVVVRNTKILRLAGTKGATPLKHGLSGAPTLPIIVKPAREEVPAREPVVSVSSPSTAFSDAGPEEGAKSASKQNLARLERERLALQTERDTVAELLRQTAARHQEATAELTALRETCAGLTRERDTLLLQREQAGDALASKDEELAALSEQLETLTPRYGDLEREHDLMVENLAVARQDIARLGAEREAARESSRQAAKRQEEAAARLEESRRELERLGGDGEAASQLVATLEGEKKRLAEELEGVRRELSDAEAERDALRQRLAALEEQKGPEQSELADLRAELARLAAEKDAGTAMVKESQERQDASVLQLEDLRRQLAAVEAQRDEAVKRAAAPEAEKGTLGREPERPFDARPPLSEGRETAADFEPFPPRDLPALHDVAGVAHPAFGEPFPAQFPDFEMPEQEAPRHQEQPQLPEGPASNGQEPVFVPLGDLHDGGFFSAADDGDQVRFFLEAGRSAIECAAPDEVLELHRSVNNAYLSPEGVGGQENCQGFICSLRKGEAREVFAAIYGTKSGRVTVYLPEQQPTDDDSYARTMRGAISFAEEVGLMMEPVTLEGAAAKKLERLKQCPALKLAEQK